MLGRYVAGTLLILGVAMMVAPPAPETAKEDVAVARGDSAPSALATPSRVVLEQPIASPAPAEATPVATESRPAAGSPQAVEAAVLEALGLDQAEESDRAALETPEESAGDSIGETAALATDDVTEPEPDGVGVLAGLGDPGFLAVPTASARDADQAGDLATTMFVTGNRVNVRSGPSTDYRVVGSVVAGDAVELVTFTDNDWAQVRLIDGEEGYMSRSFLRLE